jgi:excisionase family DNA binding protein
MAAPEAAPVPPNDTSPLPEAVADATLDIADIAKLLKTGERTARRLDRSRAIPGRFTVGRLVRFHRGLVLEWIGQGCPTASNAEGVRHG